MPAQTETRSFRRFRALNRLTSWRAARLAAAGKSTHLRDLTLAPLAAFVGAYVLRGRWRCGRTGFVSAVFTADGVFVCYAKLWERQNRISSLPAGNLQPPAPPSRSQPNG